VEVVGVVVVGPANAARRWRERRCCHRRHLTPLPHCWAPLLDAASMVAAAAGCSEPVAPSQRRAPWLVVPALQCSRGRKRDRGLVVRKRRQTTGGYGGCNKAVAAVMLVGTATTGSRWWWREGGKRGREGRGGCVLGSYAARIVRTVQNQTACNSVFNKSGYMVTPACRKGVVPSVIFALVLCRCCKYRLRAAVTPAGHHHESRQPLKRCSAVETLKRG